MFVYSVFASPRDQVVSHHMYVYLRADDDSHGKAGTPYYVGISSGPEGRRRFAVHRQDILVPSRDSGLNVVIRRFDVEVDLKEAEKAFIEKWGRIGIDPNGVLLNCSSGGEFKNDPEWSAARKKDEGVWRRRYIRLCLSCRHRGLNIQCWDRRVIDAAFRHKWGKGAKRAKYKRDRQAFALWTVLSLNDDSDDLYVAAVTRLLQLKVAYGSLRKWLSPGQNILWLDEYWTPADCCSFLDEVSM